MQISLKKIPIQTNIHIIDNLYYSIKKFEGLNFVDPNYICNIKPFNVINKYVWHYNNRVLFTVNSEIENFLKKVFLVEKEIFLSNELETEINEAKLLEAKFPVVFLLLVLRQLYITAVHQFEVMALHRT